MQKVYLLLRGNQQTGPYSLAELIKFDLKPYDLIWIEGKSAGWYYPQEIAALQPYLSFIKPKQQPAPGIIAGGDNLSADNLAAKKIFVSMPSAANRQEQTSSSAPLSNVWEISGSESSPEKKDEAQTTSTKSPEDVEKQYMNWAYQKTAKKRTGISLKGAFAACLVLGLAFAAWWLMKPYSDQLVEKAPEPSSVISSPTELPENTTAAKENQVTPQSPASAKKTKVEKTKLSVKKNKNAGDHAPIKTGNVAIQTKSASGKEYNPAAPVLKGDDQPVVIEKRDPVIAEAPKEKKKLRDKIFDLFRKKTDEKKEDAKPVEEDGGRRNSTRRENGSNLAQLVSIQFSIPNSWMMGIKGAKATLTNKSSEALVKATVELAYYNDDNELVERRTIFFTDVKSKQTKTIAVPDHATATRLEYTVISAVGANEPFAKL